MFRLISKGTPTPWRYLFSEKKDLNKVNLKAEYKKVWDICKPELPKYLFNSILTLLHAGMFMYLPNIYSDINYLMSLKVTTMPASEIYYAYLIMTSKWAALFGAMGILTYRRRYYFFYHQILVLGHFQSNQCPHEKYHVQTNSSKIILQTV